MKRLKDESGELVIIVLAVIGAIALLGWALHH